ncbi:MAG: hypothetical protein ABIH49_01345 [archaeon]
MGKIIYKGAEAVIILVKNEKHEKNFDNDNSLKDGGGQGCLGGANEKIIIKERTKKSYRLPEIDEKIRKQRTKSEAKILEKASKIIPAPIPLGWASDFVVERKIINQLLVRGRELAGKPLDKEKNYAITMPFIDGKKLSEHLDLFPLREQKEICRQIGKSVAKLHERDIIHGDLTTSNMIYVDDFKNKSFNDKLQDTINPCKKKNSYINNLTAENPARGGFGANIISASEASSKDSKLFFIDFGLSFISHKIEDKAVDLHLLKQALESRHFKSWTALFDEILKNYNSKDKEKVLEQFKKVEQRGRYKEKY